MMSVTVLTYSKTKIDKAGGVLRRKANGEIIDPDEYAEALVVVNHWRSLHGHCIRSANTGLRSIARSRLLIDEPQVTERHKRIEQIENKLGRESSRLTQMQDIAGVRLVVPTLRDVYVAALQVVRNHWNRLPNGPKVRVDDYIKAPKPSGYRCLHIITKYQGYAVEYQIRTVWQNEWANMVESFGGETGINFKAGEGPQNARTKFRIVADQLSAIDEGDHGAEIYAQVTTTLGDLRSMYPQRLNGTE